MSATAFRARNGFDAADNRLINLADPALDSTGNAFEPLDGINWKTLREHTGLRIVANEAARKALEQAKGELIIGDVVLDQDTGLAWRYAAAGKWEPFGRGGLTYVGRQGNLPDPSTDTISHGQLFVVRMDFGGEDLYRLVAWDETMAARASSDPANITFQASTPAPVMGVPTVATLTLSGLPNVANAEMDVVIRLATTANGNHLFLYRIQPGEDLNHVIRMLVATYNAAPHDPDVRAAANGPQLILTGSPGSPALPGRTVQGGQYVGEVTADAQILAFLGGAGRQPGDFVVNTTATPLTTPDGQAVPTDTAVILESLMPLAYHVADAPTPLPPIGTGTQAGTGAMTTGATLPSFIAWLNSNPAIGDYFINVGTQTVVAGGIALQPNFAVVQTPAGFRAATVATPPQQQMAGGIVSTTEITGITDQASFNAALLDPANQTAGAWMQNTLTTPLTLWQATNNPNLNPGQNFTILPGDWVYWNPAAANGAGAWWGQSGSATMPGATIGGTPIPGAYDPPIPPPEANYPLTQQPPAQPSATVGATAQVDPTHFTTLVSVVANRGPTVTPPGGGWRWLNRRVWDKALRSGQDQPTDQRPDDLQVTREQQHQELKAWNDTSGQWDIIYSRDEINAAIAAMSLFEGTVNEVGGAAIGALELTALPDLAARTAANDLSEVSHYWTWIGSPNYAVDATTPIIGTDLNGAILNPGDWIQIANRGGDGSGVGPNGGPPDLKWVTVGGDLLAKARADRLFGLLPWTQGGWEQGALVLFQGDVYRASQPVTASDPSPNPQATGISVPLSGAVTSDLVGGGLVNLPLNPANGDVEQATGTGSIAAIGEPFYGWNYNANDRFVYSSNPAFAGQGVTAEGFTFDGGWIAVGQLTPIPNPLLVTPPAGIATPWQKVDISGGLKVAQDDASLPATAPAGQVWIVLQSGRAGGKQALYSYDAGSGIWQELGGGGVPIDLTGGQVVYPRVYYVDQDLPGAPTGVTLPPVTLAAVMTALYTDEASVQANPPDFTTATVGEWWAFTPGFSVPAHVLPAWAGQPDFTTADLLVYIGGTTSGVTQQGYTIIDGVARLPGLTFGGGSVFTPQLKPVGIPDPQIAGDMLATKIQAGFPLIKAVSMDGATWSWYHPQRVTFNTTGSGRSAKADYPTQLNVGFANNKAYITHIADRNLDWQELNHGGTLANVWQVVDQGEFQTTGQQQQDPVNVSFPAHGTTLDQNRHYRIDYNVEFNGVANIEDRGAPDGNWIVFGAELHYTSGGVQTGLYRKLGVKQPIVRDSWDGQYGFTGHYLIMQHQININRALILLPEFHSQFNQRGTYKTMTVRYMISRTFTVTL